ncbi:MAG: hypothetical protein HY614_05455, partial [Candidatus Rokubacteria bacterium]|nr:hypothetical protein [Candidatus Rokubacteria bacterium]
MMGLAERDPVVSTAAAPLLLVDDDTALTAVLGELFEEAGYTVVVANTGRDALVQLR